MAGPGDDAGVRAWLADLDGRPGVVVADDVGSPAEWTALGALPSIGARAAVSRCSRRPARPARRRTTRAPVAALRRAAAAGCSCAPARATPTCSASGSPALPLPDRPGVGWLVTGAAIDRVQVARRRTRAPGTQSSSSSGTDLLRRVPGQLVTLGLVDDELRVLTAEVGLQDDVDRRADVLLRLGAVDVCARDVLDADVALDPGRAAVRVGVVERADLRVRHVGGDHDPPPGRERVDVDQPQARPRRGEQGGVLEFLGVGLGVAELVELAELRRDGERRVRAGQAALVHQVSAGRSSWQAGRRAPGSFPSSMKGDGNPAEGVSRPPPPARRDLLLDEIGEHVDVAHAVAVGVEPEVDARRRSWSSRSTGPGPGPAARPGTPRASGAGRVQRELRAGHVGDHEVEQPARQPARRTRAQGVQRRRREAGQRDQAVGADGLPVLGDARASRS